FLIAGCCYWQGMTSFFPGQSDSAQATATIPAVKKTLVTAPIGSLRVGPRVSAENPEREETHAPGLITDPSQWRLFVLRLDQAKGNFVDIECLQRHEWLNDASNDGGKSVWLDLKEMGAVGRAEVIRVEPCPAIEPADGAGRSLITATFRHHAGN